VLVWKDVRRARKPFALRENGAAKFGNDVLASKTKQLVRTANGSQLARFERKNAPQFPFSDSSARQTQRSNGKQLHLFGGPIQMITAD